MHSYVHERGRRVGCRTARKTALVTRPSASRFPEPVTGAIQDTDPRWEAMRKSPMTWRIALLVCVCASVAGCESAGPGTGGPTSYDGGAGKTDNAEWDDDWYEGDDSYATEGHAQHEEQAQSPVDPAADLTVYDVLAGMDVEVTAVSIDNGRCNVDANGKSFQVSVGAPVAVGGSGYRWKLYSSPTPIGTLLCSNGAYNTCIDTGKQPHCIGHLNNDGNLTCITCPPGI